MKKYVLFLFALSAFAPCLFAQTSENALTQARDYISDQMVLALLQNVKDSGKYKSAYDEINQSKKIEEALPADALQSTIKNTKDSVLLLVSNHISAMDVIPFINSKTESAARSLVNACFDTMKKYDADKFSSIEGKRKSWTTDVANYLGSAADNAGDNKSYVSIFLFCVSVLLLLALLAGAVYYLLQRFKRVEKKLSELKKSGASPQPDGKQAYYDVVNKPQTPLQKNDVAKLIDSNKTIAEFQKAIETLQEKVFQLETAQKKSSSQPNVAPPPKPADMAPPPPPKQEPPATEVFYMGGPVSNYFPTNVKSLSKENTVYKFTVKANKEEALFELHTSGAPIKEIVSLSESYIKPACDEENMPPANVRNIVTVKPGLALLEGDKWIIKNKALIRYE